MLIDKENQVGSYHRSISWQITRAINQMTPEQRGEFQQKLEKQQTLNWLKGEPVNQDLLSITKRALAEAR